MSANVTAANLLFAQAMELAEGEQLSGAKCPFCEGGTSHEGSLSMKREFESAYYKCHRNACNRQGKVSLFGTKAPEKKPKSPRNQRLRQAYDEVVDLPEDIKSYLKERYHMDNLDIARGNFKWSKEENRLFMPIRNYDLFQIGGVFRSLEPGVKPKTLTMIVEPEHPVLSYVKAYTRGSREILIVEDQISAARAGCIVTTAALLGTSLNINQIRNIAKMQPEHVVLCLDADAFQTAIKHKDQYAGLFKRITVTKPPCDLKDMQPKALREFLDTVIPPHKKE